MCDLIKNRKYSDQPFRQPCSDLLVSLSHLCIFAKKLRKRSTAMENSFTDKECLLITVSVFTLKTCICISFDLSTYLLLRMREGILLDPVYSAKGMAGLIGLVRAGFFEPTDNVLFLHTGGSAALFAYEDQLNAPLS